jgi:hypothetical protein
MRAHTGTVETPLTRAMDDTGKLVVGGTVSTGLLLGGYTVAAMTLAQRLNGNALLVTSLGLFIVGAVVGLVVSAAFGVLGREQGVSWKAAGRQVAKGALYAVPACMVGAILAGWIAMAIMGLYLGRVAPLAGTALAALVGVGVMAATFRCTCRCGANLVRRIAHRVAR